MTGWRLLGAFWIVVALAGGGGVAWLSQLGPPAPPRVEPVAVTAHPVTAVTAPAARPAPAPPGTIAPPDPALLVTGGPDGPLPRIAADGRTASIVYGRPAGPLDARPRVALLLVGFGMSGADSRQALDLAPAEVTFGVSPYAPDLTPLLAQVRARGHEYLVTLPMESQGYPLNDSGPHALLTGAAPDDNERNLHWVLAQVPGAAGVSGASDGLRGERFASATMLMGEVRKELHDRGLFYVDPRPPAASGLPPVVVLDDPPTRAELDVKLALLEQRARDGGAALGLVGALRPAITERVAAWARGLDGRGVALVPVSALEATH